MENVNSQKTLTLERKSYDNTYKCTLYFGPKKTFIENCADDIVANGVEHFENSNLEVKTVIYSH